MTVDAKDAGKTPTLEETAAEMGKRYPNLPEDQITGSEAWKNRVQAEEAGKFRKAIKGAGKVLKTKP